MTRTNALERGTFGRAACVALLPHAPILIPQLAATQLELVRPTVEAMRQVAEKINRLQPGGVVVLSPHSPRKFGAFGVWGGLRLRGDLGQFGAAGVAVNLPNDLDLGTQLKGQARQKGVPTWSIPSQPLDHGAVVPLWYLVEAGWRGPTLVLSLSDPGGGKGLAKLGQAIGEVIAQEARPVALIASGDLSHRLSRGAPAGYDPRARQFDEQLIDCIRRGQYRDLQYLDPTLQQLACEDALDSVWIAAAAVNWNSSGHAVLSYQGPLGVGYAVAILLDAPRDAAQQVESQPYARCREQWADALPRAAREALRGWLFETLEFSPALVAPCLAVRRGVFVTIRSPDGQLRGCVGTLVPESENILEETRCVARLAAYADSRFSQLVNEEFQDLRLEVSVVNPPEKVLSETDLDPSKYGVIVSTADGREGCLLPGLPSIQTRQQQLASARKKGAIGAGETTRLQRFATLKFHEKNQDGRGGIMIMPHQQATYPARWWSRLSDGRIECQLCPRACKLREGQRGFCFVRQRRQDRLVLTTYGHTSGLWVDPIEKKPLNHFYPGTSVLSFGTIGCNLACRFCQNWDLTKARELDTTGTLETPKAIARAAKAMGCKAVAFTYNEPAIFAEYVHDVAQACRNSGIQTVAVTAGFINPVPRADFYRDIDAANVDLKGFTDQFYRRLCLGRLGPVLDTLEYLHTQTPVWLEVTSLLIPGENDGDAELHRAAEWFVEHLGPDVPWHFTGFHPDYKLRHKSPTPEQTLQRARSIARSKGIHYAYTGNVRNPEGNSTYCPACRTLLIQRDGFEVRTWNLKAGHCSFCGQALPGKFENCPGTWGPRRMPVELE